MANARVGNVIVLDESGAIGPVTIEAIKLVAADGADATFSLKRGDTDGVVFYEAEAAASGNLFEDVCVACHHDVYATIGGTGAKAYIYLK